MKSGFYARIARNNLKKNYRFFIPRILSEIGLVGCFYIALTLAMDSRMHEVRGGAYIVATMWIGTAVLALLSAILIFYTNSFLMKQRKREFGVYNVLGMEKRHIGKVLFHESGICSLISVVIGLCFGILFYKLCALLICRLLQSAIVFGFYFITPKTLLPAGGFFILLDLLAYLFNRISIARMNPVELLQSQATGEREPKVKWLLLVPGILTLCAGYYISLTTDNPLEALALFFIAVVLVIIGTYCLFITGTIFVLKLLKNKSAYYYDKRHMPAVSGLLYRMKQNAVGLASIAILATGVLVMISSTVSLYSGYQISLDRSYPQDLYLDVAYETASGQTESVPAEKLEAFVRSAAAKNGLEIRSVASDDFLYVTYLVENNILYAKSEYSGSITYSNLANFIFISAETYEKLTGASLNLGNGEIALCRIASSGMKLRELSGTVTLHGDDYRITRVLPDFPINVPVLLTAAGTYGVVVENEEAMNLITMKQRIAYGEFASDYSERICVTFTDRDQAEAAGESLYRDIKDQIDAYLEEQGSISRQYALDSYWDAKENLLGMYGTLLFLGILLGAVCLFATALIIYYKQISEGYEDRERFQIMEKIGMSREEVRKTINSQVLLVFFLPLIVAGIHLAFAAPMLLGMMAVLKLVSKLRFIVCMLITYAVFAVVYVLIYSGTSKTYFKIVR